MLSRLVRFQVELHNPERGAVTDFPVIRFGASAVSGANVASVMPKNSPAGMGTKNFITEILDTYAALDKDRKQKLIDYSSRLAEEQRAQQRAAS